MTGRPPGIGVADADAARALLARLDAEHTQVDALLITRGELIARLGPGVTPADGIRALRHIKDKPAADVLVDRRRGYAELIARAVGRRIRFRTRREDM